MNNNIVNEITAKQIRDDIPQFSSGDTVKVYYRIVENKKERIQVYEGVVIQRRGHGVSETFVVRKMSSGVGVERTFPVNSPSIAKTKLPVTVRFVVPESTTCVDSAANPPVSSKAKPQRLPKPSKSQEVTGTALSNEGGFLLS